jgi:RNA polymerase sigma factor (sigma-70 family)
LCENWAQTAADASPQQRAGSESGASSLTVLERVAAGDAAAVDECLQKYSGLIWSLARRFTPRADDAEDAVQEVFIDVWRYAGRFNPSLGSEVNYVGMIAKRRLIDRHRKRLRSIDATIAPDAIDVAARPESHPAELAEQAQRARASMEQLRPQERQVLELFVHGMSHSEIAKNTRMPLGTVKTHARRGLARLRDMLGENHLEARP